MGLQGKERSVPKGTILHLPREQTQSPQITKKELHQHHLRTEKSNHSDFLFVITGRFSCLPPTLVFKRNRSVASSVLFKNVPTCFLRLCHKSESCARETAQSAKSSIPRSHRTHTKGQACSSGSVTATVKAVRITCAGKVEPGRQSH